MITVDVFLTDGSVAIKGHAGYGERGKDIVCAAVSMAADILQCGAERTSPHVISDDGKVMRITGSGDEWTHVLIAAVASLSRAAERFPQNLEVAIHG